MYICDQIWENQSYNALEDIFMYSLAMTHMAMTHMAMTHMAMTHMCGSLLLFSDNHGKIEKIHVTVKSVESGSMA